MYPVSNRNRFIIRIPPTQCSCPFVNRQLILTFCSSFIQLLSSSPASSLCQRPFLNDRKCYRFLEWLITYYKSSTYTLTTSLACQPLSWYSFSFPSVWPTVQYCQRLMTTSNTCTSTCTMQILLCIRPMTAYQMAEATRKR